MDIIKVAVIGLIGSLISIALKSSKSEFSSYIGLAACILVMFFAVGKLQGVVGELKSLISEVPVEGEYVQILLKMTGMTYICELSGSLCKDMGHTALAEQIEIFGRLSLMAISFPVIMKVLEFVGSL